jgi:hypothetical protein
MEIIVTLRLLAALAVEKEYRMHVSEVTLMTAASDGND